YLNKGQLPNYSKSPYEALIEVTIDTSMSGNDLKQVLLILTQAFDEIQSEVTDSIKLNVFFDYFRQTKVPPPSPSKNDQLEIKF
ncbi:MAG: hypothetical protein KDC67_17935, partial [Ignavibacteriae bacterium]|nr:hypothetical protein [Ignavibacteriota bacterium]